MELVVAGGGWRWLVGLSGFDWIDCVRSTSQSPVGERQQRYSGLGSRYLSASVGCTARGQTPGRDEEKAKEGRQRVEGRMRGGGTE